MSAAAPDPLQGRGHDAASAPDAAVLAYVAVGSNLGDRAATIDRALDELASASGVRVLRRSRLIETEPVGPPGQGPYLNGTVEVATDLTPRALLDLLLAIERRHGRNRAEGVRNGPRTLDLDLLLYGELVVDEPGLTVPHPRLHERLFVLEPLVELAGDHLHPILGNRLESILRNFRAGVGGDAGR